MNEMRRIECEETGKAQYFELDRYKCRRAETLQYIEALGGMVVLTILGAITIWIAANAEEVWRWVG